MHTVLIYLLIFSGVSFLVWLWLGEMRWGAFVRMGRRARKAALHRLNAGKIRQAWPDALLLMAGALQSGMNLEEALSILRTETPEPLRSHLQDALGEGTEWMPLCRKIECLLTGADLALPRAALLLSQESGGRAAALLKCASALLRQKMEMEEKRAALTAQARGTAWIVGFSPFGFLGLMAFLAPEMTRLLWTTKAGVILLGILVLLVGAGFFVVRRMMRPEED